MRWSGVSHSMAAVVGVLFSAALVEYSRPYFPVLYTNLESFALDFSGFVEESTGLRVNPVFFVPLFVLVVLGFCWGWLYHRFRHGRAG
jgi:hypothetical protein